MRGIHLFLYADKKIASYTIHFLPGEFNRAQPAVRAGKPLPEGENTLLTREFDDSGALLSGGEAQKVTIARMFAKNFDIAILDEPSSALDPIAESKMYDSLIEGTKGKAVIYISHRLSSATQSDRILVFSKGKLIESGTHDELMELGGEYCEMFTLQASGYKEEVAEHE